MKSKQIGFRLGISFCLLIPILIGVGCFSLRLMSKMNAAVHEIVQQRWGKVQLSREALRYSTLNNRITMQIFLMTDRKEIDALLVERAKNTDTISGLFKQVEKRLESEEEKKLFTDILSA